MAHRDDLVAHCKQIIEAHTREVNRLRVIRRHPLRQRRQRRHGSGDADPRPRLLDGHHAQRLAEPFAHHIPRCRHFRRRRRVGVQAAFGQPDTADVGGIARLDLALAEHHLRRPAAEVDHDERSCGGV
ncbi:hypothetical protein MAGR_70260 [Mycolicibacterium agri]|uniref:Uncharacterized protein n=1 Tax=Mycolicibacterium agri TaxID=36811 RepID=A0A7I9WCX5_MYCAG|nr:hypothetical protein MAGR_70260 [Mycolicibacterium agri]